MSEPDAEVGPEKVDQQRPEPGRLGLLFGVVAVGSFALGLVAIRLWDRMPSRDELARLLPQLPRATSQPVAPTGREALGLPTGKAVVADFQKVQEALRDGAPSFGPSGGLIPRGGTPIPSPTFPVSHSHWDRNVR
jgi:hypothetical protein